jgi:hypothetical protein
LQVGEHVGQDTREANASVIERERPRYRTPKTSRAVGPQIRQQQPQVGAIDDAIKIHVGRT